MLASLLLNYSGLSLLCLAMERHGPELLGRRLSQGARLGLRLAGWSVLALSLAHAAWRGGSVVWVEWVAVLMAGGVLWVWLLPYRPRLALGLAGGGLLLGPLGALGWL
jgi:hypothetical protein